MAAGWMPGSRAWRITPGFLQPQARFAGNTVPRLSPPVVCRGGDLKNPAVGVKNDCRSSSRGDG